MEEKIINSKLIQCFQYIIKNILEGFSGFIALNCNGLLNELQKDISLVNQIGKEKINNIINSQYIEFFDMIFCELYFENKIGSYLNGAPKGKIIIPLSKITKFSDLYIAENNYEINLLEVKKLTSWIISESKKYPKKLDCIYISDRMADGEVEYISYDIDIK